MTLGELFREAARIVASSHKYTACAGVAKASGYDAMLWADGMRMFREQFIPDGCKPISFWWAPPPKDRAERIFALYLMAEIADDLEADFDHGDIA